MPKSLFARAALILLVPMVLVQLVVATIFFDRHWEQISRHMSASLASEMGYVIARYIENPTEVGLRDAQHAARAMGIDVALEPNREAALEGRQGEDVFPQFYTQLRSRLAEPFLIEDKGREVHLYVQAEQGVLHLSTTRKRLVSVTTTVFAITMIAASAIFVTIALIFLRNQIMPIKQLAKAADRFGRGQDIPHYRPRGAREVRQAGQAFLTMRDRIQRQIQGRTDMLVGISHDLRAPLARLKLELAMKDKNPTMAEEMQKEIEQLEHMIHEYLLFAKGSHQEKGEEVRLAPFVRGIVDSYRRNQEPVDVGEVASVSLTLRPHALRRAIQNLIDNALRYGASATVQSHDSPTEIVIQIEDKGPGIAEADIERAMHPFVRLDQGEESHQGVGLGLTIARDIVHSHGGTLVLENVKHESEISGLRAVITLPKQTH